MDQSKIQEYIATYYAKLPNKAQDFFAGQTWMETLAQIKKQYTLNEEQVKVLATETTLVLLSVTSIDEFKKIIDTELNAPKEITSQIISSIENNIFDKVIKEISESYNKNIQEGQVEDISNYDPKFNNLPIVVQQAINKSDYQKKLYAISARHKLQVDQMSQLEQITIKLLKGELSPSGYETKLGLETDLSSTKVKEIVDDVNNDIMKGIRELVIKKPDVNTFEEMDEEIPIPPYKKKEEVVIKKEETQAQTAKKDESFGHQIYKEAGIEIIDENQAQQKEIPSLIKKDSANLQAQIQISHDQQKVRTEPPAQQVIKTNPSILNKLSVPTQAKTDVKEYNNLQKSNVPIIHDPYHEEI